MTFAKLRTAGCCTLLFVHESREFYICMYVTISTLTKHNILKKKNCAVRSYPTGHRPLEDYLHQIHAGLVTTVHCVRRRLALCDQELSTPKALK